ncbi:hypothetical protein [Salipiger pallidus]|uniref:hypothetical protein n=1 Tax=Salipiger pallidus TaxID=1775170 RepID=UPI001667FCFF|nr:hypothetical protein [Salipiger pallidus]
MSGGRSLVCRCRVKPDVVQARLGVMGLRDVLRDGAHARLDTVAHGFVQGAHSAAHGDLDRAADADLLAHLPQLKPVPRLGIRAVTVRRKHPCDSGRDPYDIGKRLVRPGCGFR